MRISFERVFETSDDIPIERENPLYDRLVQLSGFPQEDRLLHLVKGPEFENKGDIVRLLRARFSETHSTKGQVATTVIDLGRLTRTSWESPDNIVAGCLRSSCESRPFDAETRALVIEVLCPF